MPSPPANGLSAGGLAGETRTVWAVEVRDCTTRELPQVLGLWDAADAEPTVTDDLAGLEALLSFASGSLLVALHDDVVIGTLICGWDGWRAAFYRLAVAPMFRRQGIATALVREGERRLHQWGARRIAVIAVESAPAAVPFWIAAGYVPQTDRSRLVKNLTGRAVADDPDIRAAGRDARPDRGRADRGGWRAE